MVAALCQKSVPSSPVGEPQHAKTAAKTGSLIHCKIPRKSCREKAPDRKAQKVVTKNDIIPE